MTTSVRPHPPVVRLVGAILGLAALIAAMVLSASPASAHAALESSSPKDGATLTAVPPEITLQFNEPIQDGLNQVSVKSGSTDVAEGSPQIEGSSVYQPVDFEMKAGEYTVSYKVVSADGHPVSGTFSFTYAPPEGDTGADRDPEATTSSAPSGSQTSQPSSGTSAAPTSEPGSPSETSTSAGESETSEPSSTSAPADGETSSPVEEPSETSSTSSPTGDEAAADEQEATGNSTSPWWWAAAVGALVVVIGGFALLVRGRRDPEDEDVTIEEWRQ